jgi:hypothetical protein
MGKYEIGDIVTGRTETYDVLKSDEVGDKEYYYQSRTETYDVLKFPAVILQLYVLLRRTETYDVLKYHTPKQFHIIKSVEPKHTMY